MKMDRKKSVSSSKTSLIIYQEGFRKQRKPRIPLPLRCPVLTPSPEFPCYYSDDSNAINMKNSAYFNGVLLYVCVGACVLKWACLTVRVPRKRKEMD